MRDSLPMARSSQLNSNSNICSDLEPLVTRIYPTYVRSCYTLHLPLWVLSWWETYVIGYTVISPCPEDVVSQITFGKKILLTGDRMFKN